MPEPTPEELAEQERLRKRRADSRERTKRYSEKKKLKKIEQQDIE